MQNIQNWLPGGGKQDKTHFIFYLKKIIIKIHSLNISKNTKIETYYFYGFIRCPNSPEFYNLLYDSLFLMKMVCSSVEMDFLYGYMEYPVGYPI